MRDDHSAEHRQNCGEFLPVPKRVLVCIVVGQAVCHFILDGGTACFRRQVVVHCVAQCVAEGANPVLDFGLSLLSILAPSMRSLNEIR